MSFQASFLTIVVYFMVRTTNQTVLGFQIQDRNKFFTMET